MMGHASHRIRTLLCTAAAIAFLGTLSPAQADATTYYGWFDYNRNNSNIYGCLSWGYIVNDVPPVRAIYRRAGSGVELTDRKNVGWLPPGFYEVWGHWNNYSGTQIWGRVWWLSNKYNSFGDLRTGLFIHSEETAANGQNLGYEPQRWDGDNDYFSSGCIKLAYPADIDTMHWYWNYRGGTTAHYTSWPYPMSSRLYVH